MINFISNLISGLSLGAIYALIALGYTMVYGIAKMLNFAHACYRGAFKHCYMHGCRRYGRANSLSPSKTSPASFGSHNRHRCKLLFTELGTAYIRGKPKKLSEVHRYVAYQIR